MNDNALDAETERLLAEMRAGLSREEHEAGVRFAERRARLGQLERDVRAGVKTIAVAPTTTARFDGPPHAFTARRP